MFNRNLGEYKTYVNNKTCPESSITEAYVVNESLTCFSMYLWQIETKFNWNERNDNGGERAEGVSIFSQNARSFGKVVLKESSHQEIDIAH